MPAGSVGEINVKMIGAQGNGTTDDTAVINAAIVDAAQNNGGVVFFPPGIYVISSSLVMTGANNIMFRGSGVSCTQIIRASGFAGATFSSTAGVVRVRDMSLPDSVVSGLNTPPAIPSSTTPLVNPFPFDCQVYIIAGTVTVISVAGNPTGLTSAANGVTTRVQAGQSITLTYSVIPTSWVWFGIGG